VVSGLTPLTTAASDAPPAGRVRIATFNSSLNRGSAGELLRDLSAPGNAQAATVAEIIQRVRPDVLLLQEFDHDAAGASLAAFQANYLERSQDGQPPIHFAYQWFGDSNTGLPSGHDLDNDGRISGGADALGFGEFPGQYAMVLLSRHPIDTRGIRTFRKLLWRAMPDSLLPDDWYSPDEVAVLPLSSKSHWDLPVRIGRRTVHLLISHPTPPTFDGPEDRNGRRNHDEIRFWRDYLTRDAGGYIRDDQGARGGFRGRHFIIMGDLNSDPVDGDSRHEAIRGLLALPSISPVAAPGSAGAEEAARVQGGVNASHRGDARSDTADFNDRHAGNLRVDYLLPGRTLVVCDSGVFWPLQADPLSQRPGSDHRLVWMDLNAGAGRCPPGNDPTASVSSHPRR
jgi:endonuclease/exonuclease/phosphatase family metal-dependent hydrolase